MNAMKRLVCLTIISVSSRGVTSRGISRMTAVTSEIIEVAQLKQLIKDGKVKVIDTTFSADTPKPDWRTFKKEYYGNFDKLTSHFVQQAYVTEHIPGAVHFNIDTGTYVSEYQKYALYPPEVFQRYARKLGINNGDSIVVYGRGPLSGMLFSSKVWWMLKYYGLENVKVLNGGLEAWKKAGKPVNSGRVVVTEGNFVANLKPERLITFEELERKGQDNKAPIDKLETINVYDGRPAGQYSGATPQTFASSGPITGFHLKGARNLPSPDLVNENGLKSPAEIKRALELAGYTPGKPTITYCALGMQASLVNLALTTIGINDVKVYHGSLTELALREPAKISA